MRRLRVQLTMGAPYFSICLFREKGAKLGCDIHLFIERKNKETGKWENIALYKKDNDGFYVPCDAYRERNYMLFGMLAGVRGANDPFVYPRDIPDDLSDEVAELWDDGDGWHTPTWYDFCELKAYYNMMKECCKVAKERDKYIDTFEELKQERKDGVNDGEYCDLFDIEVKSYEERMIDSMSEFMSGIENVMDAYWIWNPKPGEVRVVMWFDS